MPEIEVHVWYAFTDKTQDEGLVASCVDILAPSELERHTRFLRDSDRHEYLVAHALLRLSLSRFAGVAPRAWEFEVNEYDKPEVAAPEVAIRFNISHTRGLVACAVTREVDVGVDVEFDGRVEDVLALGASVFSPAEMRDLRSLPPHQQRRRFFEYWTLKEAYIKARGMGMSLPLDKFTFVLAPDESVSIQIEPELNDDPRDWQFKQAMPSDHHHLALAVRASDNPTRITITETVPFLA